MNKKKKPYQDEAQIQDTKAGNVKHKVTSEDSIELKSPAVQGEETVSGSMPDPESEDLLEDVHEVGEQEEEDLEHPEPLDLGRDIDKSEEKFRES